MLKVGDLVKVTGTTDVGGLETEIIPIGTICEAIDVGDDGFIEVVPYKSGNGYGYWYDPKDLEKGRLEWIPERGELV